MKATLLTPAVAAATFALLPGNPCFAAPFTTDNAGQVCLAGTRLLFLVRRAIRSAGGM